MDTHDDSAAKVRQLYEAYPYPAGNLGSATLAELAALLRLFFLENKVTARDSRLLDVGTGSGNRLLGVAEAIPSLRLTGVDFSAASVALAQQLAAKVSASTCSFVVGDILSPDVVTSLGGNWPLVTCMGVLHHIPHRERALANLHALLAEDGFLFLYVYGTLGSSDRLLTKELVRLLRGDPNDREDGIRVAKAVGAAITGYGWQTEFLTRPDAAIPVDDATRDISIVDALLHDYEVTFTMRSLAEDLSRAGFTWCAPTGITVGERAFLVDCELRDGPNAPPTHTNCPAIAGTPWLRRRYEALPTLGKLEVMERLYKPNGYTVVVGRSDASKSKLGRRLSGACLELAVAA